MLTKRKTLVGSTAVLLIILLVAGTFAWTNFNSQALNEWRGRGAGLSAIGPGGTLHNYHDENGEDKQIFIENWGSETLFVRIRLNEYMEVGSGAGLKAIEQNAGEIIHNPLNQAESLIQGANIDDVDTWRPHALSWVPGLGADDCGLEFHDFWSWEMGGQAYFFPAPIDKREDKSFVAQGAPGVIAGSINDEGVQARQTRSAQVVTMAQWRADGSTIGDYWVLDTNGWAYWASPLESGDTTGLLLNRVTQITSPEEDYYYGINVIAQMATRDLDDFDNYRRFGDPERGGMTLDGRDLMERIVLHDMSNNSNIVRVEPVWLVEDGITRISVFPPLLNGVAYVRVGGNFDARGFGISHVEDAVIFNPLHGFTTMPGAHTQVTISYYVMESTPIGHRNFFTAATALNFRDPVSEAGPVVTIPFVIIPAESERVVFGRSGRVYIHFGNNQFQELIEGATPSDNMILGPMIGIDEIE